ncbi:MAG: hypothetical protein JRJ85_12260 [Deltaproteobacteria bacterium]|nr:hypothetical protein [Deltaproteobacteria bacterium]
MKISVIGAAGTVGSCTAYTLAIQGLADEIVMIDKNENVLLNHVLDITTAMVGQKGNVSVRKGNDGDLAGSDIVIVSAGVHFEIGTPLEENLGVNVPIIQDIFAMIERHCPEAVAIIATNPVDLLNYAAYCSVLTDKKKFIGYNLNDSIRFRMMTAEALGVEPNNVEAFVMGEHPRTLVSLFSSIKVSGKSVTLDENAKKKVGEGLRDYLRSFVALKAGRTAGWTTAAGIATMVRAVGADAKQVFPCSAVLEGEYGLSGICVGVPAVLGKEGVLEIPEWDLAVEERQELDQCVETLTSSIDLVRKISGKRAKR